MSGFSRHSREVICSGPIAHRHPQDKIYSACSNGRCSAKEREVLPEKPVDCRYHLFRPKRVDLPVCPTCGQFASVRVCPECKYEIPAPNGPFTIAVVGSSSSGKTCFITMLIHQIKTYLARPDLLRTSAEFETQAGREYFDDKYRKIFVEKCVPEANQKESTIKTIQITVRFPLEPRFPFYRKSQAVLSLGFPDPSGEPLEDMEHPYFCEFLQTCSAVLLMVDPFAMLAYQNKLRDAGEDVSSYLYLRDATYPLNKVIKAIRMQSPKGMLKQQLAVVLTKCDAEGLFNPDREYDVKPDGSREKFPKHGIPYMPKLTDRISQRVAEHLTNDLGMASLVAMAENNFRDVRFFAASALGSAPVTEVRDGEEVKRLIDPEPTRVEEPFLWILNRWGYI